jgi:diguanylate cyclase (GGDEF)-like protein
MLETSKNKIPNDLNLFHWLHDSEGPEHQAIQRCFEKAKPCTQAEVEVQHGDGESGVYQLNFVPVVHLDKVLAVVLVYRSVTDEVRLQREYRIMLEKEKKRGDELERMVQERTKKLEKALEEVMKLSRIDPLTGLLNRRAFWETVDPMLNLIKRHKRRGAVMICDLDHFKSLNDTYGHQAGDIMLVEVGKVLKEAVRKEDVVCRYGGEEFLIFLSEVKIEGINITAQRCLDAVQNLPFADLIPGKKEAQTMSMGIALIPDSGFELETLVAKADKDLYQAKQNGRNRYVMS